MSPNSVLAAVDSLGHFLEYVSKETIEENGVFTVRIVESTSVYFDWKITVWCSRGTVRVQPSEFRWQMFYKRVSADDVKTILQRPTNNGLRSVIRQ